MSQTTTGPAAQPHGQLRRNSLGLISVLAQTVSEIGPSASVAILVGLIAAISGPGSWLTWVIATALVMLAAYCFSQLAKRHATSGGLPNLIARIGGPVPGLVIALLIGAYGIGLAPFLFQAFGIYARDYVVLLGYHGSSGWLVPLFAVAAILGAALLCVRDVKLSMRVMLGLELISVVLILALMIIALVRHHGGIVDTSQLTLRGVGIHAVFLGVVLAMLMFVTFECSTTLGVEARNSQTTIPRSLYGCVLFSGGLLIVCAYIMTLAFEGTGRQLAASANPLADVANLAGVHWLSYFIQFGVTAGILSGTVAFTNWVARMIYTLGQERILPSQLGRADPRHATPKRAITLIAVVELAVILYLTAAGLNNNLTIYGYFSTYFTMLYLGAYVCALLVIAVLAWRRWHQPILVALALVSAGSFGYVIYNSVFPAPPYPLNNYTYAGVATIVLTLLAGLLGLRRHTRLRRIGTSGIDLDTDDAQLAQPVPAGQPQP